MSRERRAEMGSRTNRGMDVTMGRPRQNFPVAREEVQRPSAQNRSDRYRDWDRSTSQGSNRLNTSAPERTNTQRSKPRQYLAPMISSASRKDMKQSFVDDSQHKTPAPKELSQRQRGVSEKRPLPPVKLGDFNFSEVFKLPSFSKSPSVLPAQSNLEITGGDYSRYLPRPSEGDKAILNPSKYAQLTLARRRDVGLQGRDTILRIVSASIGAGDERQSRPTT
jgi:hypothetical protein